MIQEYPLLYEACGMAGFLAALLDPSIREIRVGASGVCFVIHRTHGKCRIADVASENLDVFLRLIANHHGTEFRDTCPRLAVGDPALGFRIQASRPPVSPGLTMVLRKHPSESYTLAQFEESGILTSVQRSHIES